MPIILQAKSAVPMSPGLQEAFCKALDPVIIEDHQRIIANDGDEDAQFGSSIAISGNTAVVGATGVNGTDGCVAAGAVYIFVNDGNQWVEQEKLALPDGQERDLLVPDR